MGDTVNPIIRDESLRNLSGDHHLGLLFCRKIRHAVNSVETKRLARYAEFFYREYLLPHFRLEEKFIFPLMGEENTMIEEAMKDHRKLKKLFEAPDKSVESLLLIEKIL